MRQKNAVYNMGSERGTGFRPEEIFYYLFFAIMLFAKGIGLYEGMKSFRLCIIAAFFCFVVKVCLTEHTVGELVQMLVLMAFGVLAYRNSGELAAFIYVLVVAGMKHVPVKRVFKVGAAVWTVAFFSTIVLALLKRIPDLALVHSKLGLGHIIRWSLGYPHPNVLHISYVILLAFFFYLANLNRKQLIIATALLYACNFYIFLYSVSYTGLILTTVYLLANLYFNLRKEFTKAEKVLIQCIYPVCALLSVLGPVFIKGKLFDIFNKMMNTRWNLSRYFLTEQRISFFGTKFTDLPDKDYNIDCSYVYILMYYGIVLFVIISIGYFVTIRREVKLIRRKELAIMTGFLVAGMSEPFMANLSFKNLTLIFIGECYYAILQEVQEKKPDIWWNKKLCLFPWADSYVTVPFKGIGKIKNNITGTVKKGWGLSLVAGLIFGLAAGVFYYKTADVPDAIYADSGISDYWGGEKVKLDRNNLPADFQGEIIGTADGNTDLYVLKGNIIWLELIRGTVTVGIAGVIAGWCVTIILCGIYFGLMDKKRVRK